MKLVLASTSIYRKELLNRLGLPFVTAAPEVDESIRAEETPLQLVRRLDVFAAETHGDLRPQIQLGCLGVDVDAEAAGELDDFLCFRRRGRRAEEVRHLRQQQSRTEGAGLA